jgi:hypothetical protein
VEDTLILYFHSKVSISNEYEIINNLFKHTIEPFDEILNEFKTNPNLEISCAYPSISGFAYFNFFWTRANYIKKYCIKPEINENQYIWEIWIGKHFCKKTDEIITYSPILKYDQITTTHELWNIYNKHKNEKNKKQIYIYGDSHAERLFKNLLLPHKNVFHNSITMNRIGRDNIIINFDTTTNNRINEEQTHILVYGEVDSRCHIYKQIEIGRNEDDIINELVTKYFETIKNNIINYKNIIIVGIVPPLTQENFDKEFANKWMKLPLNGTNEERLRYRNKINKKLQEFCIEHNYVYFAPYDFYEDKHQFLKYELSDLNVHIEKNQYFLNKFMKLFASL